VTFLSLDLRTDTYTFLNAEGQAVSLSPSQVFNYEPALEALPLEHQSLIAHKMVITATKSA